MFAHLLGAALAAAVTVDPSAHRVSFTAEATGLKTNVPVEFLFAGPGSDHDYESMFLTEAPVGEIAAAFERAGIPLGKPMDAKKARFWPVGVELEMTPKFEELIAETRGEKIYPIVYTGGERDQTGGAVAATNMPLAVFALYNHGESIIAFDDTLDQSETYGRFVPKAEIPKGEKREFVFTWKGAALNKTATPKFVNGNFAAEMEKMKALAADGSELDLTPDFSPSLTIKEAGAIAASLALLDSSKVKVNGYPEGQLYYRAYLPMEKWRDRAERLCQPPEVVLLEGGKVLVNEIVEDWSDPDSTDPKLSVKEHRFDSLEAAAPEVSKLAAKTMTVLFFAEESVKLERVYALRKGVSGYVPNWYVFVK